MNPTKYIFNADQIVMVQIRDKRESERFIWQDRKETKNWWGKTKVRKEGFLDINGDMHLSGLTYPVYTKEEVEAENDPQYFVEDKKAYIKACVILRLPDGKTRTDEFNTYEEALAFGEDIASRFNKRLDLL